MGNWSLRTLAGAALTTVLASGAVAVAVAVDPEPQGLWQKGSSGKQTQADCGPWRLDQNNFCVANDQRNGLEVGVKFRTSKTLKITGVRIYRVDTATLRGSLWASDGTLLAQGTLPAGDANQWQDMKFPQPVTIVPNRTYVASYFTPGTKYAFEYFYFEKTGRTVGPITALRAAKGDPNGVHCYDDAACGSFPVRSYKDSSFFVSPLWIQDGTGGSTTNPPTASPAHTPTASPTPAGPDRRAPRVVTFRPSDDAKRVRVGANATVRFSEPVRTASIKRTTVRLQRAGSKGSVRAALHYDANRAQVVINPRSPLRARTRYRLVVTSGVRDIAGNRLDQAPSQAGRQRATSTFRTR